MSLVSKLFSRRKSQYLLDVEELSASGVRTSARTRLASGWTKRFFAGALIAVVGGSGLAAGFMTYAAAAPAAQADWISDIVCVPAQDQKADGDASNDSKRAGHWDNLGGKSALMQQSAQGALSPLGLEQLFSAVTARKYAATSTDYDNGRYNNTVLEVYGGFYPFFDGWSGAYDHSDDKPNYFYGTGGLSGTSTNASNDHYRWVIGDGVEFSGDEKSTQAIFSHSFTDCVSPIRSGVVTLSNIVFLPAKVMVTITNGIYGWSMSLSNNDPSNPIYVMQKAISSLIVGNNGNGGLKDQLYLTFLPPILMVATFGLFYQGVVRNRARGAAGAAMWMLFATVAGYCFVSNPMLIPGGMNNLVQNVSSAITGAIVNDQAQANQVEKLDANGKQVTYSVVNMCSVDGNVSDVSYSFKRSPNGRGYVETGTSPQNYVRQTQCAFWYALIYEPWVTGQFGVSNSVSSSKSTLLTRDPRGILAKTSLTLGNANYNAKGTGPAGKVLDWPLYELTAQAQGRVTVNNETFALSTNNLSEVAFAQLTDVKTLSGAAGGLHTIASTYTGAQATNGAWGGGDIDRQTGAAMLSFWGSLVAVIFVLVSAITLIGLQFGTLFLIAISPFFFLLGVAPGWGRRVLARWFELIMEIVIKRIMVIFVLALYVKFFTIIVNMPLPYLFRVLALAIISFIALFQRAKITKIFTDSLRFGGNQNILNGKTKETFKKTVKTTATLAAAGGIAVLTAGAGAPVSAGMVAGTGLAASGAAAAGGAAKGAKAAAAVKGVATAAGGAGGGGGAGGAAAAGGLPTGGAGPVSGGGAGGAGLPRGGGSGAPLGGGSGAPLGGGSGAPLGGGSGAPLGGGSGAPLGGGAGAAGGALGGGAGGAGPVSGGGMPLGGRGVPAAPNKAAIDAAQAAYDKHQLARPEMGKQAALGEKWEREAMLSRLSGGTDANAPARPSNEVMSAYEKYNSELSSWDTRNLELSGALDRAEQGVEERDGGHLGEIDGGHLGADPNALFGEEPAPLPVPAPSGPVAPSAPSTIVPQGRLAPVSTDVNLDEVNAKARRQARIDAAKYAALSVAKNGGKLDARTLLGAAETGMAMRDKNSDKAMQEINRQASMVAAQDAENREVIRIQEEIRANDLAQAEAAAEQRRHEERQRDEEAARAAQASRDAVQAARDAANAKTLDDVRRATNRVDRKLNGPRQSGGSGPRATGGGNGGANSGPKFPRKD